MIAPGDRLVNKGWIRFPTRLPDSCLTRLEDLQPFDHRGQRLMDLDKVSKTLPNSIKTELHDLGYNPLPRRAVGFNKHQNQNWSLPWHQDRIIQMVEKTDDPNLTHWTRKNNVWHCEPSAERLAKIAFLYIAFDPMTTRTGQLELLERTHCHGKIKQTDIPQHIKTSRIAAPNLNRGEALFITSLLLHRSSVNQSDQPRRALRLDFEKY